MSDHAPTLTRVSPTSLSTFQRSILGSIAQLMGDDEMPYGLAIKDVLEARMDIDVNHGRLYPNLDTLVQNGLVEKREVDKRTNEYRLTDDGAGILRADALQMARDLAGIDAHHDLARWPRGDSEVSDE